MRMGVENVSMGKTVRNNSFSIYAGQITGIFGLVGSGRTETAKIISGVLKRNFFHGGETSEQRVFIRLRGDARAVHQRAMRHSAHTASGSAPSPAWRWPR